jgi:hypothetical protein
LGVLTAAFPRPLVDEVIDVTGKREQRTRLLPAHLTVYYVLAMTFLALWFWHARSPTRWGRSARFRNTAWWKGGGGAPR